MTHEADKPVEPSPAETATADYVQLDQDAPAVDAATGPEQADPPTHNETAAEGPTEDQAAGTPEPPKVD